MTIKAILEAVSTFKKISVRTCYNLILRLDVKPIGARQHPQIYPPDTAERILRHLGFSSSAPSKPFTPRANDAQRAAGIVTLKQLKKHQPKRGGK